MSAQKNLFQKCPPSSVHFARRTRVRNAPAVVSQLRRDTVSASPRCCVNLAEILCQPRRDAVSTSPRCCVNLAEILCQPRRDTVKPAISRRTASQRCWGRAGCQPPSKGGRYRSGPRSWGPSHSCASGSTLRVAPETWGSPDRPSGGLMRNAPAVVSRRRRIKLWTLPRVLGVARYLCEKCPPS